MRKMSGIRLKARRFVNLPLFAIGFLTSVFMAHAGPEDPVIAAIPALGSLNQVANQGGFSLSLDYSASVRVARFVYADQHREQFRFLPHGRLLSSVFAEGERPRLLVHGDVEKARATLDAAFPGTSNFFEIVESARATSPGLSLELPENERAEIEAGTLPHALWARELAAASEQDRARLALDTLDTAFSNGLRLDPRTLDEMSGVLGGQTLPELAKHADRYAQYSADLEYTYETLRRLDLIGRLRGVQGGDYAPWRIFLNYHPMPSNGLEGTDSQRGMVRPGAKAADLYVGTLSHSTADESSYQSVRSPFALRPNFLLANQTHFGQGVYFGSGVQDWRKTQTVLFGRLKDGTANGKEFSFVRNDEGQDIIVLRDPNALVLDADKYDQMSWQELLTASLTKNHMNFKVAAVTLRRRLADPMNPDVSWLSSEDGLRFLKKNPSEAAILLTWVNRLVDGRSTGVAQSHLAPLKSLLMDTILNWSEVRPKLVESMRDGKIVYDAWNGIPYEFRDTLLARLVREFLDDSKAMTPQELDAKWPERTRFGLMDNVRFHSTDKETLAAATEWLRFSGGKPEYRALGEFLLDQFVRHHEVVRILATDAFPNWSDYVMGRFHASPRELFYVLGHMALKRQYGGTNPDWMVQERSAYLEYPGIEAFLLEQLEDPNGSPNKPNDEWLMHESYVTTLMERGGPYLNASPKLLAAWVKNRYFKPQDLLEIMSQPGWRASDEAMVIARERAARFTPEEAAGLHEEAAKRDLVELAETLAPRAPAAPPVPAIPTDLDPEIVAQLKAAGLCP